VVFTNKAVTATGCPAVFGQVSRRPQGLRVHKLIKKTAQRYKYYLTDFGREVAAIVLKLARVAGSSQPWRTSCNRDQT